ncbi:MAG: hypothetical protein IKX78_02610 [Clostridia bacterium]|nr:hypothetical protein [Clostridia bacterium]
MADTEKRTKTVTNLIAGAAYSALAAVLFVFSFNSPVYAQNGLSDGYAVTRSETDIAAETEDEERTFTAEDYAGKRLYYTPFGKKWHLTRECQYLRNSETILYTDYEDAVSKGLTPCSKCGYPDSVKD